MANKVRGAMDRLTLQKATSTSATTTDTVLLINGRPALPINSAAANAVNVYMIGGEIEYASDTGTAWSSGDTVYWDDTNKRFTKTSTSNTKAGICYEDKASAATTGFILLIPTP